MFSFVHELRGLHFTQLSLTITDNVILHSMISVIAHYTVQYLKKSYQLSQSTDRSIKKSVLN